MRSSKDFAAQQLLLKVTLTAHECLLNAISQKPAELWRPDERLALEDSLSCDLMSATSGIGLIGRAPVNGKDSITFMSQV